MLYPCRVGDFRYDKQDLKTYYFKDIVILSSTICLNKVFLRASTISFSAQGQSNEPSKSNKKIEMGSSPRLSSTRTVLIKYVET